MASLLLNIRRGETPFYNRLRRFAGRILFGGVRAPRLLRPVFRLVYRCHWGVWSLFHQVLASLYVTPVFASRCESAGPGLFVFLMPHVIGQTRIHLGDNVKILGKIGITSGRVYDEPALRIGNNVVIAHQVQFSVNQEIVIEDDVYIAGKCTIADNDGHARQAGERISGAPPSKEEIRPVYIRSKAWIGEGVQVRKGVTIGEAAIVGINSVVLKDVPAHCIAMGNPAKVVGFSGDGPRD